MFDQVKAPASVDDLAAGNEVVAVVELDAVWVSNGGLGASFKAKQLQVFKREELKQFIIS